jgi:hypothetical protein
MAVGWALLIVLLSHGQALPADEPNPDANSSLLQQESRALEQSDPGTPNQDHLWTPSPPPDRVWTIDYQFRSLSASKTVYEFGTPDPPPEGWAPLSRLEFPVSALWHGLKLGFRQPNWDVHFEWLTPMVKNIDGDLHDYDWMDPEAGDYTDLGIMQQRWIDGQMLDLGLEIRAWKDCFGLPVDFWPTIGFRWQRFNIMAYDLVQVKEGNVWPPDPYTYQGDVISFHQQYYLTYLGGQLRGVLNFPVAPVALTFQADWANAQAYNVDHHLLREGDRYTMERTHGDSWHVALTAEAPITKHISIGCQVDYLQIRTRGTHHWLNEPLDQDETWDNGVRVWSDQTWLTAFVGFRI